LAGYIKVIEKKYGLGKINEPSLLQRALREKIVGLQHYVSNPKRNKNTA
jgi:hypothetical protein